MLLSFMITIFLSTLLVLLLIKKASFLGLIAVPNDRSVHQKVTPSGAGLAFISAMFIGVTVSDWSVYSSNFLTVGAILLVFILGVYDDYKNSSSNLKFLFILFAGVMVYMDGVFIHSPGNYFGFDIPLFWFALPVTLFAIIGFTNALNLVDGLDGLAGAISLIILGGLGYIGYIYQDAFMMTIVTALISALLVFMIFNWNPAKIFMGDSGSLTIGFIIAVLSIKSLDYIDPVSILFITAIPILDTVTVMVRRKRNGLSMVSADKNHLHHIVLDTFNGNVKKTVLLIACIQLLFTLFGVFITSKIGQEITLPLFIFCSIILYLIIEKVCHITDRSLMGCS